MQKLFFFFLLLGLLGCKKTDIKNPFKNQYTVEGRLYYDYSLTPVPLVDLVLYAENLTSVSAKPKPIAFASTDISGYFKFTYAHNKKNSRLYVMHEIGKNPVNKNYGILARNIDGNENYTSDIFINGFGLLNIKVILKGILTTKDTLYIGGINLLKPTGYYHENLAGLEKNGLKIPIPFVDNEMGPFTVYYNWSIGQPQQFEAVWGINKKDYTLASQSATRNQKYTITGYPQINQLTIEVN